MHAKLPLILRYTGILLISVIALNVLGIVALAILTPLGAFILITVIEESIKAIACNDERISPVLFCSLFGVFELFVLKYSSLVEVIYARDLIGFLYFIPALILHLVTGFIFSFRESQSMKLLWAVATVLHLIFNLLAWFFLP